MARKRGRHLAPKLRRISRGWAVTLSLVMLLVMGAVAWADDLEADGDAISPFGTALDLGTVCLEDQAQGTARVAVKRAGNYGTKNVFLKGSTATVTVESTSGDGLTAVMDNSPAQISIPTDWDTAASGQTFTDAVSATVTLNTSAHSAGAFSGSVTFNADGPSSQSGNVNTRESTVTVVANLEECSVNEPPTVDAGGPYSGNEGSAVAIDGTVTDDDSPTIQWSYSLGAGVDAGATCDFGDASSVSTTVTCTDDGTFTLTLTADDGVNDPVPSNAALTVSNVAPSIGTVTGPPDPVAVNTFISVSAPFTDPGTNDTHTCTIDWGDASTDTVVDPATSPCGESHGYGSAGIYTVSVTITDDDGDSDTEYFQYVVVYDPSAGFVTGGGWISSPEGAYVADPSLTGKATFGFVSKYKKGANVPEGNTEFQFHAGSLNFKSTTYEWLVVSGSNKAQFKGVGTINGTGQYGFLLSVIDGGNTGDKFRIKIWDADDNVVYDNNIQSGNTEITDDPATAISGGSIVIHVPKK